MVRREKAEKASLLAEFENRAKASGFTLSDLFGDSVEAKMPAKRSGKGQASTIPPKYRNPQNSLETWTGRGRFPAWVKELKEAGGNLDACLIDPKPASLLLTE
jgi:DNA-binding protein H-NS